MTRPDDRELQFRNYLKHFVFFHLGSDASLEVVEKSERIKVSIEHNRIRPIQFELKREEMEGLVKEEGTLEEYMLNLLIQHRRSY